MKEPDSQNKNPQGAKPPSEEQIETLLKSIQPWPSTRFHQRMQAQPWNRREPGAYFIRLRSRSLSAGLALALLLAALLSFRSPTLQALADRMAQFFTLSSGDRVEVQVPMEEISAPQARFSLSIPEAVELAGFEIKVPTNLPLSYTFRGADYNSARGAVTLNYETAAGFVLRLSQRPVGVEYQHISPQAGIQIVEIEGLKGEYVSGGWKATQTGSSDPGVTQTLTLQAEWDPEANIHFLRWQEDDILYEILFSGDDPASPGYLQQEDLIALAEGLP